MDATPPPLQPAQRHGCLTAFLVFMLLANSATLLIYLLAGARVAAALPDASMWRVYLLGAACAFNIFLTISLFRWKKWAFYAFCAVAGFAFIGNLSLGVPLFHALVGLVGPAVLFGVLHIGGSNKGWPQLK